MIITRAFALGLLLNCQVRAEIISTQFKKVNSNLPSSVSECSLQNLEVLPSLGNTIVTTCGSICAGISNCRLFCIKGLECYFYGAFVTGAYSGEPNSQFGFDGCYTTWFYLSDVAPTATITMHSYQDNMDPTELHDGYFCFEIDSCSATLVDAMTWIKLDFGRSVNVKEVILKTRDDELDFSEVELRLGDSSVISNNNVYAMHSGSTPLKGTVSSFKPLLPMQGRYLSFQSVSALNAAVAICEVQVIEG